MLQHGLLGSALDWVQPPLTDYSGENLPEAISWLNDGYDVWLANSRGSKYSLGHKTLKWKTSSEYWDFSFGSMAYYDLNTMARYIESI